jgi:hypothetical protein
MVAAIALQMRAGDAGLPSFTSAYRLAKLCGNMQVACLQLAVCEPRRFDGLGKYRVRNSKCG